MNVLSTILVLILALFTCWFFWGSVVQVFASPQRSPSTVSKGYWLLTLILLLEIYDLKYGLLLPAAVGAFAFLSLVMVLVKRAKKLDVPRTVQLLLSCSLSTFVFAHFLGLWGVLLGISLGLIAVFVQAPWSNLAAEMWDEPWWSVQAHRHKEGK